MLLYGIQKLRSQIVAFSKPKTVRRSVNLTIKMKKIVALFNVVGYTTELYGRVIKELDEAGKLKDPAYLNRVVAQQADGLLIIDVWDSEEALNEFAEVLVPILLKNGVTPAQPTLLPLVDITL
jgi:hypothetical protein